MHSAVTHLNSDDESYEPVRSSQLKRKLDLVYEDEIEREAIECLVSIKKRMRASAGIPFFSRPLLKY